MLSRIGCKDAPRPGFLQLSGVTSEPRSIGFYLCYLAKVLPLPADESILLGISAFRVPTEPRTVIK